MKMRYKILHTVLPILLAALLFFALLWQLYLHDNKYTDRGLQPISGMLVLSEGDLAQEDVYFLTRGWQFYPDVLLTPADFTDGKTPDAYMQTVTIGKSNNWSLKDLSATTGGSGSYHLTLALPEEQAVYTLVLPEIYSAYRLYVNGSELVSVGIPEANGFTQQHTRKRVSFAGAGNIELLIAVSNRSHFADGMIYPPIWGPTDAVSAVENTRLMLGIIMLMMSVLCTALSLYLLTAFRGKRENKITFFFLTSLCITGIYLYPLVYYYAGVSPTIWYGVELCAIYGSYLFAVMLQNELCDTAPILRKISGAVLCGFCVLALLYGLLPAYQVWMIRLFGVTATIVKFLTIGYLIYCAVHASLKEQPSSRFLLFCTTAFGVSILFDRLFPGWEPIRGGWPTEYGCAMLVLGFGIVLWRDLSEGYRFKLTFAEEKRQLTRQVAIQKAHYLELTDKIEDTVRIRHDERHHLQTLYGIYEARDYERLGDYLSGYVLTSIPAKRTVLCRNLIVDSMLRYYEALCEDACIAFSSEATLPPDMPMPDVELSILFGNLLENACEGAAQVNCAMQKHCDNPFVSFRVKLEDETLYLLVENSFATPVQKKGERFLSTKHESYGIGTQSARSVAQSYGSDCVFEDKNGVFSVTVLLRLDAKEK